MVTGWPKPPTFRSIALGIGLAIVLLLAFFRLSDVVKYTGAVLMYIPSRIGLIEMVMPQDVIPISIASSPTKVYLPAAGSYELYTENYDLLFLHNAAVDSGRLTWIKIQSEDSGNNISVRIIERGLVLYDTPFAKGRPIVTFSVDQLGNYIITHPTRPDRIYVVRDYVTGYETRIIITLLFEVGLVAGFLIIVFRRRSASTRHRKKEILEQARKRAEEQHIKMEKMRNRDIEIEDGKVMDDYEPSNYWKKK